MDLCDFYACTTGFEKTCSAKLYGVAGESSAASESGTRSGIETAPAIFWIGSKETGEFSPDNLPHGRVWWPVFTQVSMAKSMTAPRRCRASAPSAAE